MLTEEEKTLNEELKNLLVKETARELFFKHNKKYPDPENYMEDKVIGGFERDILHVLPFIYEKIVSEYANQDKWISADENPPDHNGYFICWLKMPKEPGLIHYHKDTGWSNGFYNGRVTHWRIINPPKH